MVIKRCTCPECEDLRAEGYKKGQAELIEKLYYSVERGKIETRLAIECFCMENNIPCSGLCRHCKAPIALTNPSGYCNHIYYPDNDCDECEKIRKKKELSR